MHIQRVVNYLIENSFGYARTTLQLLLRVLRRSFEVSYRRIRGNWIDITFIGFAYIILNILKLHRYEISRLYLLLLLAWRKWLTELAFWVNLMWLLRRCWLIRVSLFLFGLRYYWYFSGRDIWEERHVEELRLRIVWYVVWLGYLYSFLNCFRIALLIRLGFWCWLFNLCCLKLEFRSFCLLTILLNEFLALITLCSFYCLCFCIWHCLMIIHIDYYIRLSYFIAWQLCFLSGRLLRLELFIHFILV